MSTEATTDFEAFLGYLGAIEAAALRGYGPGVLVDLFIAPGQREADGESGFRIRLIGRLQPPLTRKIERHFNIDEIRRSNVDPLAGLIHFVEHMARLLKAEERR